MNAGLATLGRRVCIRVGVALLLVSDVSACGSDDGGDLVIRRQTGPTSTTMSREEREELGLNTDVYCLFKGTSMWDWEERASPEDVAEVDAMLDGRGLGEFFREATEAETRRICDLMGGRISDHSSP